MNKKKLVKILVVEDEKFWVDILREEIKRRNLEIEFDWVDNGEKAVDVFRKGGVYDAVLMNLEMPLLDGDQATEIIRGLGVRVPIIAWTAHSQPSFGQVCMKVGMNGFIEKLYPNMMENIIEALGHCGVAMR